MTRTSNDKNQKQAIRMCYILLGLYSMTVCMAFYTNTYPFITTLLASIVGYYGIKQLHHNVTYKTQLPNVMVLWLAYTYDYVMNNDTPFTVQHIQTIEAVMVHHIKTKKYEPFTHIIHETDVPSYEAQIQLMYNTCIRIHKNQIPVVRPLHVYEYTTYNQEVYNENKHML